MMKHEFETILGCEVSHEEYKKIESVYMWLDDFSKEDIAKLFRFDEQFVLKTLYNKYLANERIFQRNTVLEGSDTLVQELKIRNSVLNTDNFNLIEENKKLKKLEKVNDGLIYTISSQAKTINKLSSETRGKDIRIEELETELQQYRTIFGNIVEMVGNI